MSWFEGGHARVYYEETGAGDPVLLLPGWGGSIDELTGLRDALASKFRVIAADLPGSGRSDPQPRTYTPSYFQEDIAVFLAMLEKLAALPGRVVGFSDGGEYALLMAATKPQAVHSVLTWGAAGSLGNNLQMADAMSNLIDSPIPPMADFSSYMKEAYGEANARVMTRSFGQALRAMMEAGGDITRSHAASISCPALLITGENDFIAPPALVSDMAGAMQNAEFIEVKGASHAVHHDKPDWLRETALAWLTKH